MTVACAGSQKKAGEAIPGSHEVAVEPEASSESKPSQLVKHEPGIYDVETGEKIERDAFYDRLARATYVVVGESHTSVEDHAVQDQIYRALIARHDGPVALGLEMVSRPYQVPLDEYAAGTIDDEELLEKLEWETRWGFSYLLYAPLWRAARASGSPIVALNARRELTKAVSQKGVDDLDLVMTNDLPELDLSDDAHRDWMRDIFASHGMEMEEEKFERFYQAQVVWDETMAETAFDFMQTNSAAAMMIVAGRGHTERGWGIPSRIERRIGDSDASVVTVSPMPSPAPSLAELRDEKVADFVVFR